MATLWLVLCGLVLVPILLGRVLHHGHRRCCRRHPPLRLTIDVTRRRERDAR
jgi:hypothetical protein